jgi:hypothetical protein
MNARATPVNLRAIRCAPGGPRGTVFAVVARDVDSYSEVSIRSVRLPPGHYTVTAALDRPGRVDFEIDGQPLDLKPDQRRFDDLVAVTPRQVERLPPAAQLECALAELAQHPDASAGRPVLVTAGSRPPHPPRADVGTQIMPCPERRDWRTG